MSKLSERNKTLLLEGARITGNFVEGYYYCEEQLYVKDATILFRFCNYIDKEIGGAGKLNIDMLFQAFKNPQNLDLQKQAMEVKEKIQKIKEIRTNF